MSAIALVSGATGGIGGVVAQYLWGQGYSLIALGRTPEKVHALLQWFAEHPREGQYSRCFVCDVGDDSHYAQLDTTFEILESAPTILAVCHGHAPIRMPGLSYGARVGLRDVFGKIESKDAMEQAPNTAWDSFGEKAVTVSVEQRTQPTGQAIMVIDVVRELQRVFSESITSGGSYVNAHNRIMIMGLAMMLNAQDILETGYNTGLTTYALAMSGARVVGIDNYFESSGLEDVAAIRLQGLTNVTLVREDALIYLISQPNNSYDLIFIDDCHWPEYTKYECEEVQRILRPGGCAVFHDTFYAEIWDVIEGCFPHTWQRINLPSMQPCLESQEAYSGVETMRGLDLGVGIVRKPFLHEKHPLTQEACMTMGKPPQYTIALAIGDKLIQTEGPWKESDNTIIEAFVHMLRMGKTHQVLGDNIQENMDVIYKVLRNYGAFCSQRASHVGKIRYWGTSEENQADES